MEQKRFRGADRVMEGGLLFLIVFTPLALGTVHFWAIAITQSTILALGLVWLWRSVFSGHSVSAVPAGKLDRLPLVLFLLFFGLVLFQLLPLPPALLRALSPGAYDLYQYAFPGWPGDSPDSSWRSLSVYGHATRSELLRLLSIPAVYFLVVHHLRGHRRKIDRLAIAVILVASLEAVYGLLGYLSGGFFFLERKERWDVTSAVGTFVNRNHFAGYLELALPLSCGFLLSRLAPPDQRARGWRGRFLDLESRLAHHVPLLVALVSMFLAIIFSRSRMGIFSTMAALSATGLLWRFRRGGERRAKAIWGLVWVGLLIAAWIGLGPVLERFANLPREVDAETGRLAVWRDSLGLVKDFPWLGSGLGTYEHIFPRYKTLSHQLSYEHAHNDYLELLTDTGRLGFALAVTGMVFLTWRWAKAWARQRDAYPKGMALGGLMGLLAFSLHGLTDFNLHILANPLLLSAVLGMTSSVLAVGAPMPTPNPAAAVPPLRPLRIGSGLGAAALCLFLATVVVRAHLAERILLRTSEASRESLSRLLRAAALDPENSEAHYRLGRVHLARMEEITGQGLTSEAADEEGRQAFWAFDRAVRLNPSNGLYHARLGWATARAASDVDPTRREELAEEHFERALKLDPTHGLLYGLYARWCLERAERGEGRTPSRFVRQQAQEGLDLYREAFRLSPALEARGEEQFYLGRLYRLVGEHDRAQQIFSHALRREPFNPSLRYESARLRWEQGEFLQAAQELREVARLSVPGRGGLHEVSLQAMEAVLTRIADSAARASWHYRLAREYQRAGSLEKAFSSLQAAIAGSSSAGPSVAFLPDAHYRAGLILEGWGRLPEARAAYRRAVDLLPTHRQALGKMRAVYRERGMNDRLEAVGRQLSDLTPSHPLGAFVSGEIRLLGYDVDASDLFVSGQFTLTLYWECREELPQDVRLEVQLKETGAEARAIRPTPPEALIPAAVVPGGVVKSRYRFVQGKALKNLLAEGKNLASEDLVKLARITAPPKSYALQVTRYSAQGPLVRGALATIKVP